MADISNKTIVSLLLVVTVVTVVGTVFSVSRMDSFVNQWAGFTGGATSGTGYINFTTGTNVAITVSGGIDFGTGYVNASFSFANLTSTDEFSPATGWINTSAPWDYLETGILINNTGNTVVNLTFQSNQSVNAWIGGPMADADARITPVIIAEEEIGGGVCTGSVPDAYTLQLNTTEQDLCTSSIQGLGFNFTDTADEIAVGVNLLLPAAVPVGHRSVTVTFFATGNQ